MIFIVIIMIPSLLLLLAGAAWSTLGEVGASWGTLGSAWGSLKPPWGHPGGHPRPPWGHHGPWGRPGVTLVFHAAPIIRINKICLKENKDNTKR